MNKYQDLINFTWNGLARWFPTIMIAVVSAWLSVKFEMKRRKMTTRKEAWWSGIIAFTLAMLVSYIAEETFTPFISKALTIGSAIFGKQIIMWVFENWDGIATGIAEFFKIKIKKK